MIKSIVENTLDSNYINYLRYIITNPEFEWSYTPTASYPKEHPLYTDGVWKFLFSHKFIDNGHAVSDRFESLFPAVLHILTKHNISTETSVVIRAQINLLTRNASPIVHGAHVDQEGVPHDSLIWYLDDSDGDTIIYDQMNEIGKIPKLEELTISQRIKPEKNKSICFDGLTYHSSSAPTAHNTRIVMNINVIPKHI